MERSRRSVVALQSYRKGILPSQTVYSGRREFLGTPSGCTRIEIALQPPIGGWQVSLCVCIYACHPGLSQSAEQYRGCTIWNVVQLLRNPSFLMIFLRQQQSLRCDCSFRFLIPVFCSFQLPISQLPYFL